MSGSLDCGPATGFWLIGMACPLFSLLSPYYFVLFVDVSSYVLTIGVWKRRRRFGRNGREWYHTDI